jgi:hypothetical protein
LTRRVARGIFLDVAPAGSPHGDAHSCSSSMIEGTRAAWSPPRAQRPPFHALERAVGRGRGWGAHILYVSGAARRTGVFNSGWLNWRPDCGLPRRHPWRPGASGSGYGPDMRQPRRPARICWPTTDTRSCIELCHPVDTTGEPGCQPRASALGGKTGRDMLRMRLSGHDPGPPGLRRGLGSQEEAHALPNPFQRNGAGNGLAHFTCPCAIVRFGEIP